MRASAPQIRAELPRGRETEAPVFETKEEAKVEAAFKDAQLKKSGTEGANIPSRLREMAKECAERLSAHGKTIADATDFFVSHLKATEKSCNASELVNELLAAKQADGASGRYLSDLKHRLKRFFDDFNGQVVATIMSAQIDDWLRGLNVAPVTRNNFRRVLIVAFNFAKGSGYCPTNPPTPRPRRRSWTRPFASSRSRKRRACSTPRPKKRCRILPSACSRDCGRQSSHGSIGRTSILN